MNFVELRTCHKRAVSGREVGWGVHIETIELTLSFTRLVVHSYRQNVTNRREGGVLVPSGDGEPCSCRPFRVSLPT